MTSKTQSGTLSDMLLERKLVKIYNEEIHIKGGKKWNRRGFIDYIIKNKPLIRLRYFRDSEEVFIRRIDLIIGDCIAPPEESASRKERNQYYFAQDKLGFLYVTEKGRDFIKPLGFYEEFRKRRRRTTDVVHERIVGAILGAIVVGLAWLAKYLFLS